MHNRTKFIVTPKIGSCYIYTTNYTSYPYAFAFILIHKVHVEFHGLSSNQAKLAPMIHGARAFVLSRPIIGDIP